MKEIQTAPETNDLNWMLKYCVGICLALSGAKIPGVKRHGGGVGAIPPKFSENVVSNLLYFGFGFKPRLFRLIIKVLYKPFN